MNTVKENAASISLMLSIPILSLFYEVLNNPDRGVHSLITNLDREIPFVKAFIIPYVGWYAFILSVLVYLCLADKKTYYKTLISYNLGLIICYIFYYVYQTTVPRPELAGNDFLTQMVSMVYNADQPYNCFPSIHCLTSYLMIKGAGRCSARTNLNYCFITASAVLIIISTLFIKQHVILDAIAAVLLGDIIFKLVCYLDEERTMTRMKKQYVSLTMKRRLGI
ncbi:phosphatase PAP2 family protein [Desulforamulus putei]|uniref:PAP2 superfamily protein n=1 Tax=Desulforamulus putei DSM 12395 TaxID=1121429 RepID=A0A1M4XI70_9FIRM|nr:phosphatase PAP2 family protein [Desulforamulus putei]SHE93254.1 PAP2 superfamily protein [Desulforamulus putei DSM 12395]